jgi:nucleotide-binding universal stress UspA family protein
VTGPSAIVVPLDGSDFAARARQVAAPLADRFACPVVEVTAEHEPAVAICATAAEAAGRVVCMSTHGRGRARRAMLGSVAERVMATTADPVLLVGRHCADDWLDAGAGIVVGADGSPAGAAAAAAACSWAAALDLDVWLVHVVHPLDNDAAAHAHRVLEPLAEQVRGAGAQAHPVVARGSHAAGAFVDAAEEVPATLLVTGTEARTGVRRVALGSFTMGTVAHAACPVLAVPPTAG